MIYRLKEFKGDTIPVPQLVFSKLGIAEEYNCLLYTSDRLVLSLCHDLVAQIGVGYIRHNESERKIGRAHV